MKVIFSTSSGYIAIWLYPKKASKKERSSWPTMASTIWFIRGREKLSFGQASIRSVKSTHTCHLLLFFRTTTMLAKHSGYCTSWMNLDSSNWSTSSVIILCHSSWNFRNFCLIGCHSYFTFKWWQATEGWIPFTSKCFHTKTSMFCLSILMNFFFSFFDSIFPKNTYRSKLSSKWLMVVNGSAAENSHLSNSRRESFSSCYLFLSEPSFLSPITGAGSIVTW